MTTLSKQPELRALVVDDEAITRGMVVFALLNEGFVCDVATDGEKAKILLQEGHYDLLVTDLIMPYMDGYALAINALEGRTPPRVIVHTAHEDPRSVKDLIVRGVDDVVSKPTDYAVFAAKARGIVARRRIDAPQPAGSDSASSLAQTNVEEQPEVESKESPEEHRERGEAPAVTEQVSTESLVAREVVRPGFSNSLASAGPVAAPPKAPFRSAKVLKISSRPSTDTRGTQATHSPQAIANSGVAVQRDLVFVVPTLMLAVVGMVLLTAVLVNRSQILSPLPTASASRPLESVAINGTYGTQLPNRRAPVTFQRLAAKAWGKVAAHIKTLSEGRTRLVKLADDMLPPEHALAASHAESETAVLAPEGSSPQRWGAVFGQALTAISSTLEKLSTYQTSQLVAYNTSEESQRRRLFRAQHENKGPAEAETRHLSSEAFVPRLVEAWEDAGDIEDSPADQPASDGTRLKAEFQRELPEIQKWLAPLLAHGYSQPVPGGHVTTATKRPMSLRALRRLGALSDSEEGLSNLARAMTDGNDRKTAEFAPLTGGTLTEEQRQYLIPARRLLLKYQSLLVEKGMLAE